MDGWCEVHCELECGHFNRQKTEGGVEKKVQQVPQKQGRLLRRTQAATWSPESSDAETEAVQTLAAAREAFALSEHAVPL